jgi:hypothetical protein
MDTMALSGERDVNPPPNAPLRKVSPVGEASRSSRVPGGAEPRRPAPAPGENAAPAGRPGAAAE